MNLNLTGRFLTLTLNILHFMAQKILWKNNQLRLWVRNRRSKVQLYQTTDACGFCESLCAYIYIHTYLHVYYLFGTLNNASSCTIPIAEILNDSKVFLIKLTNMPYHTYNIKNSGLLHGISCVSH
jgi:hypothetical protein